MKSETLPHDPYADIARYYDLEHDPFEDDIDFLFRLIRGKGARILELGTGTGRIAAAIARAGHHATGIDTSEPMLARATDRVKSPGVKSRVTLANLSMLEASRAPGGPFWMVFASLDCLQHLGTSENQRETLRQCYQVLQTDGLLLIDLYNPSPANLMALDQQIVLEGTFTDSDGATIQKFSHRQISPAEQLIDTDLWYDVTEANGSLRRVSTHFTMRYVQRAELELMLELAGFEHWDIYGGYEFEPFDDQSDRLIVIAQKR